MIDDFQSALDYLYGLANWETRPPGTPATFELDRVRRVLAGLGDPHVRWPAVHVAGTNGKGSTCVLIAAVLRAAGYRVGLYTSPHLHTVRERIRVDGRMIGEGRVVAWLNANRALLDGEPGLTTFEALTALAFDTFAGAEIDVGVIEVGLGGRLDTTNVVRSVISVLTPIGLDHTRVLGDTVGRIAEDKVGILRPGVSVVSAPQTAEAHDVIAAAAARAVCPLYDVERVARWREGEPGEAAEALDLTVRRAGGDSRYRLHMPLVGRHQRINAATVAVALTVLADGGWSIEDRAVEDGFAAVRWPARFEELSPAPVLVVDGAHNPPAAEALAAALNARYPSAYRWLLLGASCDKDVDGVLAHLLPGTARVVVTRSEHPRAMLPSLLAARVRARGVACEEVATPRAALARILGEASAADVIVAAGSLFLAAEVREAWAARGGMPMPERDPPRRDGGRRRA